MDGKGPSDGGADGECRSIGGSYKNGGTGSCAIMTISSPKKPERRFLTSFGDDKMASQNEIGFTNPGYSCVAECMDVGGSDVFEYSSINSTGSKTFAAHDDAANGGQGVNLASNEKKRSLESIELTITDYDTIKDCAPVDGQTTVLYNKTKDEVNVEAGCSNDHRTKDTKHLTSDKTVNRSAIDTIPLPEALGQNYLLLWLGCAGAMVLVGVTLFFMVYFLLLNTSDEEK